MTDQQPQQDTIPTKPLTAGLKSFSFQGSVSEYFKIWIATLFLTIITLGIYLPWAKVRRLRYFYGNTTFEDRNFDYTAIPFKMLLGLLIVLVYIAVIVLNYFYDFYYNHAYNSIFTNSDSILPSSWLIHYVNSLLLALLPWLSYVNLLLLALLPWLIHTVIRFHARNSKYNNNRFYFSGSRRKIYALFFGCHLLTILSLGLLYPFSTWLFDRYKFNHLHLAQLNFKFNVTLSSYLQAVLAPLLVLIPLTVALIYFLLSFLTDNKLFVGILDGTAFLIAIIMIPLIQARLFKAKWSQVALAENDFHCSINQWRYAWIVISNWLARLLSLGLLTPWAAIRLHRYKIENLSLNLVDSPEQSTYFVRY